MGERVRPVAPSAGCGRSGEPSRTGGARVPLGSRHLPLNKRERHEIGAQPSLNPVTEIFYDGMEHDHAGL